MKQFDKLYMNGEWVKSNSSEIIEVVNPANEKLCAKVPSGNRKDVNAAVASARQAFNSWAITPAKKRAAIMHAIADEMEHRKDDLIDAHVITMGCPRHLTAEIHIDAPIEDMRYYADHATQMEEIKEVGKEIGPVMSSHPDVDMVSFTGSTNAGIKVAEAAAPTVKRVCQELGGKSPYIITEDADLEAAVRYGVEDVMLNSGQTCNALTRMFLQRRRYEEAVNIARKIAEENVVDDPNNSSVTMGPMASAAQKQTVLDYIKTGLSEGATLVTGGIDMPKGLQVGAYVQPTILADVSNEMDIAREEIFGPVLCMIPYEDIEAAIEMANDSVYGLASGVYARDKSSAMEIARKIQAGQCYIQGSYFNLDAPFGGFKRSGNGREWGSHAMNEYVEIKAVIA